MSHAQKAVVEGLGIALGRGCYHMYGGVCFCTCVALCLLVSRGYED